MRRPKNYHRKLKTCTASKRMEEEIIRSKKKIGLVIIGSR